MIGKLSRGIKFGAKSAQMSAGQTELDIFFAHPRTYANLEDLGTQLGLVSQLQQESTFFQSPMSLELEVDASEIIDVMKKAKTESRSNKQLTQIRREFLVAGESNVGKSSLINSITYQKLSEVSSRPGKTRKISFYNFIDDQGVSLVDCPGYGGALGNQREVKSWDKLLATYITQSPYLQRTLCLIDSRKGISSLDKSVMLF